MLLRVTVVLILLLVSGPATTSKTVAETMEKKVEDYSFRLRPGSFITVIGDEGHIIVDGNPLDVMGDDKLMESHGQEKPHSLLPHRIPHHMQR